MRTVSTVYSWNHQSAEPLSPLDQALKRFDWESVLECIATSPNPSTDVESIPSGAFFYVLNHAIKSNSPHAEKALNHCLESEIMMVDDFKLGSIL